MTPEATRRARVQFFVARHITPHLPIRQLYQLTNGRIGSQMPSVPTRFLLLTVTGRRSGLARTVPLAAFEIEDKLVVGATHAGEDTSPQWYLNLLARPRAMVQLGAVRFPVTARTVEGDERERLWAAMKRIHPMVALEETATTRSIPVVVLEPASGHQADHGDPSQPSRHEPDRLPGPAWRRVPHALPQARARGHGHDVEL